jgi:hypothetical protein
MRWVRLGNGNESIGLLHILRRGTGEAKNHEAATFGFTSVIRYR